MGSFVIATVAMFLSAPLGKSGLRRSFGYDYDYLMGGYIACFILSSVLLEIFLRVAEKPKRRFSDSGPEESSIAMMTQGPVEVGAPTGNAVMPEPKEGRWRVLVMVLFVLISVGITGCLSYMIIYVGIKH
jgi:hypothetical protein